MESSNPPSFIFKDVHAEKRKKKEKKKKVVHAVCMHGSEGASIIRIRVLSEMPMADQKARKHCRHAIFKYQVG